MDIVEKVVYDTHNSNLTYNLFPQGYSSALIEYTFTDPTIPHYWYYCGHMRDINSCEDSILQDITTFTKLNDHLP